MKIVVLVKEVPDTYGPRKLSLDTGLAERGASEPVMDEIDERAIEVALSYADATPGTEVVLLSMGPESAAATVRKGLSMGAGSAVQVVDEALLGADLGLTAEVLAAALRRIGFDLVVAGNLATDGSGGVIPAMVAELLGVPAATGLSEVAIASDGVGVTGVRTSDAAAIRLSTSLPAVISITEALPAGRLPNFKGMMAAKKAPYETLTLADLGVEPEDPDAARSIVIGLTERPPRQGGVKITDEGDAGEKLAEFLIQNRLA
jgi:electron transfer flavoprotein beta subunit